MNGISHILISVIRSSWMTLQIRCISSRILMVLMGQNVNAIVLIWSLIESVECYDKEGTTIHFFYLLLSE